MSDLKQLELDLFEEKILTQFFGSKELNINPLVRMFVKNKFGIDDIEGTLQSMINAFEEYMKPVMSENGLVHADRAAEMLKQTFPKFATYVDLIPKKDFRLVDLVENFNLQELAQKIIKGV